MFRVVKGDAGWYSGVPESVQDVYMPVDDERRAPRRSTPGGGPIADPEAPVSSTCTARAGT